MSAIRPIFILSAPRSGSTLLQRIVGAHHGVATTSEPWVLLPLLQPLAPPRPGAHAFDELTRGAIEDFVAELPGGRADYLAAVHDAALRMYAAAASDADCFVDKSPVYHLVVDELVEAFPEGRFVFLWRNPLSLVASAVEHFDAGRWNAGQYSFALFQSLEDLVPASRRHAAVAFDIRYEDLVTGDEAVLRALADYLGVRYDPAVLDRFTGVALRGSKGDTGGTRRYTTLSREPLEKWRGVISTPVRVAWTRGYVRWIGRDRLAQMGYDMDALLEELDGHRVTWQGAGDDLARLGASAVRDAVKAIIPPHTPGRGTWSRLLRS